MQPDRDRDELVIDEHVDIGERMLLSELLELVNSSIPFTDIHISQAEQPMIRGLNGWEAAHAMHPTSLNDMTPLLKMLDSEWADVLKKRAINKPINLGEWRLRINAFLTLGGSRHSVVIRRQPMRPLRLEQTGLPESLALMSRAHRGIILASGPAGAGKSTTLAAMVDDINVNRYAHIITIEDPVEYLHERKRAIISQREVGVDVNNFLEGVEDAMRQRPDVILIGEIRDAATARAALLAAESGHLVLASVHANSAVGTVAKLLGFFNEEERRSRAEALALGLVGVVCQTLLPRADKSGFVAAAEVMNNVGEYYSNFIPDTSKLDQVFERGEEKNSCSMQRAIMELARRGLIEDSLARECLTAYGKAQLMVKIRAQPAKL